MGSMDEPIQEIMKKIKQLQKENPNCEWLKVMVDMDTSTHLKANSGSSNSNRQECNKD
jgi:hypothetical protein